MSTPGFPRGHTPAEIAGRQHDLITHEQLLASNTRPIGFEVDCLWPEHRLVVEIDGPGHARPRSRLIDERRDRLLRAATAIPAT